MRNKVTQTTITEINTLHTDIEGLFKTGIEKAIRIGELLTEVKNSLEHGEFTQWITDNCAFSTRTASRYLLAYSNPEKLTGADSLTQAYSLLKKDNVSFLGEVENHRNDVVNENTQRIAAFDIQRVIKKFPDPEMMTIDQLTGYLRQLDQAQNLMAECVLRIRKKLGHLLNEDVATAPGVKILAMWLSELQTIHPGITATDGDLHLPEDLTCEQWVEVGELLKKYHNQVREPEIVT